MVIIKRFLPEMVARCDRLPCQGVVQHECEHTPQARQCGLDAPGQEREEQYLGVAAGLEFDASSLEIPPQLGVIVDLAVVRQYEAPLGIPERLSAGVAGIYDRQPRVSDEKAGMIFQPLVVRSPPGHMTKGRRISSCVGWFLRKRMKKHSTHLSIPRIERPLIFAADSYATKLDGGNE